jgi:hypothetical protein
MSTDVSEVLAASIIRGMMDAARTSETSVDIYLTRQCIPEYSELHTRRRENLKSHMFRYGLYLAEQTILFIPTCLIYSVISFCLKYLSAHRVQCNTLRPQRTDLENVCTAVKVAEVNYTFSLFISMSKAFLCTGAVSKPNVKYRNIALFAAYL